MSPDERSLLTAVAAAPADDLPRLVYADWLEEHGQPVRAEFIRLQCEIARLERGPRSVINQNIPLWQRQQDLLTYHLPELLGPGWEWLAEFRPPFLRGFVAEITLHVSHFLHHAAELASLLPLPLIRVTSAAARITDLLACPFLDCVAGLQVFPADPMLPLGLSEAASPAALADATRRFTGLLQLDLNGCQIDDALLGEVIHTGSFPALETLDLTLNALTDGGITDLLNTGLPQRLRSLALRANPITDQGAFELADRLARNTRLELLDVRDTDITRAGQAALLAAFPKGQVQLF